MELWRIIVEVGVGKKYKHLYWKRPTSYKTQVLVLADSQYYAECQASKWWDEFGENIAKNGDLFSFGEVDAELKFVGVEKVSTYHHPDVFLI